MRILGYEVTNPHVIDTVNIGSGVLAGYFVVYPIVTHAAETGRDKLPGFTKGIIDNVVSPLVKTTTSWISPALPLLAKVGLVAFAGFAAKEYYDQAGRSTYRDQSPLGNLVNLGYNTGLRMKAQTGYALSQIQDSSFGKTLQAKFKQLPLPNWKDLQTRLQALFNQTTPTPSSANNENK